MKKNLLLIVLLMTLIPLAGYSQNETSTQFTVAGDTFLWMQPASHW